MLKNFFKNSASSIAIVVLIAVGAFYAGMTFGVEALPDVERVASLENKERDMPPGVDFAPFWKAWNVLSEKHVGQATTTSSQDRVWGAIEGLAASLGDPYTVFFPPEETKMFHSEISGNFEGVGMEIGLKDDIITVIAPLKGTPAERAGVLPGDKIIKINDTVTANMKVDEAVRIIRGKKGTTVTLSVIREGKSEPLEIKIIRDVIDIPTISTEIKGEKLVMEDGGGLRQDGIFVIKLHSFSATSPNLFRNALREFIDSGSTKMILDLRGNPGGYLEASVDMASWFLPAGKVVVTEDYGKNKSQQVHRSKGYDIFNEHLKMVILVNGGSASASEILAGALQEHGKARLVGTKTFGKGSVQELVPITGETSLKVTVAKWLTPKGKMIAENGLVPDVEVKMVPEDVEKKRDPQMDKAVELLNK